MGVAAIVHGDAAQDMKLSIGVEEICGHRFRS